MGRALALTDVNGDSTLDVAMGTPGYRLFEGGRFVVYGGVSVAFGGGAGFSETDTVTASGADDDGNPVSDSDSATVEVRDVPSSITMVKTANPTALDEPGGNVTYTFLVTNISTVDTVTINSLTDTVYDDLDGQGDCALPQTIAAGMSYSCAFTAFVDATETNVVTP